MQKCKILHKDGDVKLFIICGEYPDGSLGELSVEVAKEGEMLRSLMSCFCQSVSVGLQAGVPLEKYVDMYKFIRFEPAGIVQGHPRLRNCLSIIDLVFRHIAITYLGDEELAHVTPEPSPAT